MDIRPIDQDVAVADQLTERDMPLVHSLGYRSVICNRPDGETADQPLFATIKQAAGLSSLHALYVPVPSEGITPQHIADMKRALREAPKPTLAYCRSGARCTAIISAIQSPENAG